MDVTWGGKRGRYIYNYVLQSPPNRHSNDSDETESVHSVQSKATSNHFLVNNDVCILVFLLHHTFVKLTPS